MTAVFVAKDRLDTSGSGEFARYVSAVERLGFEKTVVPFEGRFDSRIVYSRCVGEDSYCLVCESLARGTSASLDLKVEDGDSEVNKIQVLLNELLGIIPYVYASDEQVCLFIHNGGDVPDGYEEWVNGKLSETKGLDQWKLALLSQNDVSRNKLFNLETIAFPQEKFRDENDFTLWVEDLSGGLNALGGLKNVRV